MTHPNEKRRQKPTKGSKKYYTGTTATHLSHRSPFPRTFAQLPLMLGPRVRYAGRSGMHQQTCRGRQKLWDPVLNTSCSGTEDALLFAVR